MVKPHPKNGFPQDKLRRITHDFAAERALCGFTLEVSDDQQVLWQESSSAEMQNAVFPIYSITKSFIGTLILRSAEEKLLNLQEPLRNFSVEIPAWLAGATVWQLLCHRSGLGDYGYLKTYHEAVANRSQNPFSLDELKNLVFDQGPKSKPDEKFLYSNIGYRILVEILEDRHKSDFSMVLQEKICLPLNLNQTFLLTEDLKDMHLGFSKIWSENFKDMRSTYHPRWVAHGLMASTTQDLNSFLRGLFTGQILNESSLKLIHNPYHVLHPHFWFTNASYGPGFMGDAQSKVGAIHGHNGGGPGYDTSAFCWESNAGERYYISIIVNQDGAGLAENLLFRLIDNI